MNGTQIQTRQILVPTGSCSGWVDARNAMKSKGGLPSSPLVSTIFVRPGDWAKMGFCKLIWTRNVLVYPPVGDTFKKGVDVVGGFGLVGPANTDELRGGRWVFPGSLIPEEAIGKNGMALFLDPDDVVVEQNRIVISARPESIKVLGNFIDHWDDFSNRGMDGLVDPETRVPLDREVSVMKRHKLTRARLFRSKGAGVEPIARRVVGFDDLHDVHAVDGPSHGCSVAYVSTEEVISPEVTLKSIPDGVSIKGLSLEHLTGLLADAAAILVNSTVDMALPKNAQDPLRSLINALSEKKCRPRQE